MTNADLRLELFDGVRWFPMEFPRDEEEIEYTTLSGIARKYVETGAAKSVRVQRRSASGWQTVKTVSMQIVEETTGPGTAFCTCGHAESAHRSGPCRITLSSRVCPCERFELREV